MDAQEARTLLDLARMLDNKIGEPDDVRAMMWAEVLPDVVLGDAVNAVKLHYRESVDTIMPAHVRSLVKRLRSAQEAERRSVEARTPRVDERPVLSDEGRAAIAHMRALGMPSRPGALKISGSVGSGCGSGRGVASVAVRASRGPSPLRSIIPDVADALVE